MRKGLGGFGLAAAIAMGLVLSGCEKEATGQVVAVVNGEEITLPELNAELSQLNLPANANKEEARANALQRIVDRRIISQQAKTDGLDRDPDFLIRQRQLNDTLLAELYAKRAQDTIRVPDQAAIDAFIAQHPEAFAQRVNYTVDQLQVPAQDPGFVEELKPLHSMAAIVALLRSRGITFDRRAATVDSAQVDAQTLAQVNALPPGEPFVVAGPQGLLISVVTGREPVALPPEQARQLATQALRNQNLGSLLEERLNQAKAKATVEYQPGYGPAKAAPKGAAAPKGGTPTPAR